MQISRVGPDAATVFAQVWTIAVAARDGGQVWQPPPVKVVQRERALLLDVDACAALALDERGQAVGVYLFTQAQADRGHGEPLPGRAHLARLAVDPDQWGHWIGQGCWRTQSRLPDHATTGDWSLPSEKRTHEPELFTNCAVGPQRGIATGTVTEVRCSCTTAASDGWPLPVVHAEPKAI